MTNLSLSPTGTDSATAVSSANAMEEHPFQGDGRNLRRMRNREAVIRSLIDLILEGDLDPTVAKIADRAELSHRSVFRYFDDLNDLARTAIETEFRESWPLSVVENVGEGVLSDRIDRFVAARIRILQRTHPLGLVARARANHLDDLRTGFANVYDVHTDQIRRHFAPELDAMAEDRADAITTAIAVTTWLDNYDLQLRSVGRCPAEIAELWTTTLHVLLD